MTDKHEKTSLLGQGVYIFVYLAVLTLLEYFVAVTFKAVALLVAVALVKAVLVVYYYMHIYKLNAENEATRIRMLTRQVQTGWDCGYSWFPIRLYLAA